MSAPAHPRLTLAEWVVLCLVCEAPSHGFALVRMLADDGELGQVWRVPKPVIYRALQRLETEKLLVTVDIQPSHEGPDRTLVDATRAGRKAAKAWLARPASHTRDIRSELLIKLALLDRADEDPGPLLEAQREQLVPVSDALHQRLISATGFERTMILWRSETVAATLRFLDAMRGRTASAQGR
jgi:DNA-binding PadR family transcriptional regulator